MKKLTFDNSWMALHLCNNRDKGRLMPVFGFSDRLPLKDSIDLLHKKGVLAVSSFNGQEVMSEQYSGQDFGELKNLDSENAPFTNLYVSSDGCFFQVSHILNTPEECNRIMSVREDVALICTDNAGRHYLASLKPAGKYKN